MPLTNKGRLAFGLSTKCVYTSVNGKQTEKTYRFENCDGYHFLAHDLLHDVPPMVLTVDEYCKLRDGGAIPWHNGKLSVV